MACGTESTLSIHERGDTDSLSETVPTPVSTPRAPLLVTLGAASKTKELTVRDTAECQVDADAEGTALLASAAVRSFEWYSSVGAKETSPSLVARTTSAKRALSAQAAHRWLSCRVSLGFADGTWRTFASAPVQVTNLVPRAVDVDIVVLDAERGATKELVLESPVDFSDDDGDVARSIVLSGWPTGDAAPAGASEPRFTCETKRARCRAAWTPPSDPFDRFEVTYRVVDSQGGESLPAKLIFRGPGTPSTPP